MKCLTREEINGSLDNCSTTISGAFCAIPRGALGLSNHVMIHLIPTETEAEALQTFGENI